MKVKKKITMLLPLLGLFILCCALPADAAESFKKVSKNMKGAVKSQEAVIHEAASAKSEQLKTLSFGNKVTVKSESANWYEVKKGAVSGYMKKSGVVLYNTKKKHLALTFDDGPGASTTKIVLRALEKNNCRATFFVVGSSINSTTGKLLKKEKALGCEIGSHSYSHPQLTRLSTASVKSQFSRTDKKVKQYTGAKTVLFRAPYGAYNKSVLRAAGKPNILWSVDTLDWKYRNTSRLISYVNKHAKDGAVILMHDIHKTTVNAADRICRNLKKKNYETVTVTELAAIKGKKLKAGKVYSSF